MQHAERHALQPAIVAWHLVQVLGPLVSKVLSDPWNELYELNIGIALGMIGVAYAFRLLRKFATTLSVVTYARF